MRRQFSVDLANEKASDGYRRLKAKWDSEAERKNIDIWADILVEYNGNMLTRMKKAIATSCLNGGA